MVSASVEQGQQALLLPANISWRAVAWFGGLLILCYAPILYRMGVQWATDEDMGHGFFVPIVAGFIAWQRRGTLLSTPRESNGWGLALVIFAAFQALAGSLGAELFTARLAFVIALFGIILYLGGKAWVNALLLPLLLMLFMIPIPQIIYARLTLGLQILASQLGETLIGWMGIPVIRTGNLLELPSQTLNIVDACSGIRSLLSLLFLSQVYAYFTEKRTWIRWVLLIATLPIAIAANAIRVATTGLLSEVNTKLAQGAYHEVEGYIVFAVALAALLVTHRVVSWLANKIQKAD
ncbi:MAG: exosortase/archaeosortase family protein [Bryobacteraceae bacterium]